MGSHPAITATTFPRQSPDVNKPVQVFFHYDTETLVPGLIVRDDAEPPFLIILQLADGRLVLGTECQYAFATQKGQ
jgi:hypothetical protein